MKFKRIKSIIIGEVKFEVIWDNKHDGGHFNYPTNDLNGYINIGIGTIKTNPCRVLAIIIHELEEIITAQQFIRFQRFDVEDEYIFMYNHQQFTDKCNRLAGLLSQFII